MRTQTIDTAPSPTGFPSPAEDYLEPALSVQSFLTSTPEATFFLRVGSDLNEADGVFADDVVIVDRSLPARAGDLVVVQEEMGFRIDRFRGGDRPWGVVAHLVRSFRTGHE